MTQRKIMTIKLICAFSVIVGTTFSAEAMKRSCNELQENQLIIKLHNNLYDKLNKEIAKDRQAINELYNKLNKEFVDVDNFKFRVENAPKFRVENAPKFRVENVPIKKRGCFKEWQPVKEHIDSPIPEIYAREIENKQVKQSVVGTPMPKKGKSGVLSSTNPMGLAIALNRDINNGYFDEVDKKLTDPIFARQIRAFRPYESVQNDPDVKLFNTNMLAMQERLEENKLNKHFSK